jgi:hypothetical protein
MVALVEIILNYNFKITHLLILINKLIYRTHNINSSSRCNRHNNLHNNIVIITKIKIIIIEKKVQALLMRNQIYRILMHKL